MVGYFKGVLKGLAYAFLLTVLVGLLTSYGIGSQSAALLADFDLKLALIVASVILGFILIVLSAAATHQNELDKEAERIKAKANPQIVPSMMMIVFTGFGNIVTWIFYFAVVGGFISNIVPGHDLIGFYSLIAGMLFGLLLYYYDRSKTPTTLHTASSWKDIDTTRNAQ
jgi:hypothetical protein